MIKNIVRPQLGRKYTFWTISFRFRFTKRTIPYSGVSQVCFNERSNCPCFAKEMLRFTVCTRKGEGGKRRGEKKRASFHCWSRHHLVIVATNIGWQSQSAFAKNRINYPPIFDASALSPSHTASCRNGYLIARLERGQGLSFRWGHHFFFRFSIYYYLF